METSLRQKRFELVSINLTSAVFALAVVSECPPKSFKKDAHFNIFSRFFPCSRCKRAGRTTTRNETKTERKKGI